MAGATRLAVGASAVRTRPTSSRAPRRAARRVADHRRDVRCGGGARSTSSASSRRARGSSDTALDLPRRPRAADARLHAVLRCDEQRRTALRRSLRASPRGRPSTARPRGRRAPTVDGARRQPAVSRAVGRRASSDRRRRLGTWPHRHHVLEIAQLVVFFTGLCWKTSSQVNEAVVVGAGRPCSGRRRPRAPSRAAVDFATQRWLPRPSRPRRMRQVTRCTNGGSEVRTSRDAEEVRHQEEGRAGRDRRFEAQRTGDRWIADPSCGVASRPTERHRASGRGDEVHRSATMTETPRWTGAVEARRPNREHALARDMARRESQAARDDNERRGRAGAPRTRPTKRRDRPARGVRHDGCTGDPPSASDGIIGPVGDREPPLGQVAPIAEKRSRRSIREEGRRARAPDAVDRATHRDAREEAGAASALEDNAARRLRSDSSASGRRDARREEGARRAEELDAPPRRPPNGGDRPPRGAAAARYGLATPPVARGEGGGVASRRCTKKPTRRTARRRRGRGQGTQRRFAPRTRRRSADAEPARPTPRGGGTPPRAGRSTRTAPPVAAMAPRGARFTKTIRTARAATRRRRGRERAGPRQGDRGAPTPRRRRRGAAAAVARGRGVAAPAAARRARRGGEPRRAGREESAERAARTSRWRSAGAESARDVAAPRGAAHARGQGGGGGRLPLTRAQGDVLERALARRRGDAPPVAQLAGDKLAHSPRRRDAAAEEEDERVDESARRASSEAELAPSAPEDARRTPRTRSPSTVGAVQAHLVRVVEERTACATRSLRRLRRYAGCAAGSAAVSATRAPRASHAGRSERLGAPRPRARATRGLRAELERARRSAGDAAARARSRGGGRAARAERRMRRWRAPRPRAVDEMARAHARARAVAAAAKISVRWRRAARGPARASAVARCARTPRTPPGRRTARSRELHGNGGGTSACAKTIGGRLSRRPPAAAT